MSMKPRLNDGPKSFGDTVTQPKTVPEISNIPGTVTTQKHEDCHPIPGTVSQKYD